MIWEATSDTLTFPLYQYTNPDIQTKRDVVKLTSSLFDPLGLVSPVHVKAKIFIQQLWKQNLHWDDPITGHLLDEWITIRQELYAVRNIVVPRYYFPSTFDPSDKYELHVFADSSTKAYGAVVYLKLNHQISLVISKTRVKPIKDVTLPRLELLAAFIATRLHNLCFNHCLTSP